MKFHSQFIKNIMNGATDRGIISLCMYKGENWSTTDQQRIELRYMNTIVSNF